MVINENFQTTYILFCSSNDIQHPVCSMQTRCSLGYFSFRMGRGIRATSLGWSKNNYVKEAAVAVEAEAAEGEKQQKKRSRLKWKHLLSKSFEIKASLCSEMWRMQRIVLSWLLIFFNLIFFYSLSRNFREILF